MPPTDRVKGPATSHTQFPTCPMQRLERPMRIGARSDTCCVCRVMATSQLLRGSPNGRVRNVETSEPMPHGSRS